MVVNRVLCLGTLALVALLSVSTPVAAQLTSVGTVSGQVTDQQGAAVEGATVFLNDTVTDAKRQAVTNDAGRYIFLNVPPGLYDLAVRANGFAEARMASQRVAVGEVITLDVKLQVGTVSSTVEVQAAIGAELQTTTVAPGNTISGPSLLALPNLGRDANAFVVLQPGVTPGGEMAGKANDQNYFSIDGGNVSSDQDGNYRNYTISSGSMARTSGGNPSGIVPTPVESVEEFRVSVNNQTADFNAAAGGQVQISTKRGTNRFHGAAYDYYFGSALGANTWSNNRQGAPLPKTHENRFGAAIGGPLTPTLWGNKTYFFFNYEGRRFPQVVTYETPVPTALFRAGVIQVADSTGVWRPYNLNPRAVTVNGVTYQPAMCGTNTCDPRAVGLNPIVSQVWNKYMPLPNNPLGGDRYNTQGYTAQLPLPVKTNFAVGRIDRDLHKNHRLMLSYRYYHLYQYTTSQVDIGGFFQGDTLGQPKALTDRPQTPSFYVAGLTSTLTSHLINDFRFSYARNSWEWGSAGAPPQLPGLAAAIDLPYLPYQTNRNNSLSRYWNGQDKVLRDDLTWVNGNHLFQFGGNYTRLFLQHQRNDNGSNMTTTPTYLLGSGDGILTPTTYIPSTVPASEFANWNSLYAQTLGMVAEARVFYPRKGGVLQPFGTSIRSANVVPNYNLYFNDTWKVNPRFTVTYGLGYQIQMPPYEINGDQPMMVDANSRSVSTLDYFAQREQAALTGKAYQPQIAFATVRNVDGGRKYNYDPVYAALSPRISAAWSPNYHDGWLGKIFGSSQSVIRGGYSRIYGRINGINIVQVPLQGTGIGQAVACVGGSREGSCLGSGGVDPTTAYRIGVDGMSAPLPTVDQVFKQPFIPGFGSNASLGTSTVLDPKILPPRTEQWTFSIQRQINSRAKLEVGYIGMISRDEMWMSEMNSVPYMMTLSGQSFAQAYSNLFDNVSRGRGINAEPFFEAALGGASSAYCTGFASCTAAVASKSRADILNTNIRRLWTALDNAPGWTLGRTLISSRPLQATSIPSNVSGASSNYNAVYYSVTLHAWRGLTALSNLTFSRTLGDGGTTQNGITSIDSYHRDTDYRTPSQDINWVYNIYALYDVPYKASQHGVVGKLLGGWSVAPLFRAQSGAPLCVGTGGESYGGYSGGCAVWVNKYNGGNSVNRNVVASGSAGSVGNASRGGSGINLFPDPQAAYDSFRPMIVGRDGRPGNPLRGFPLWNVDMAVRKTALIREGLGLQLNFEFVNLFNHFVPANPTLSVFSPTNWGVVTGQGNDPRRIEIGARFFF